MTNGRRGSAGRPVRGKRDDERPRGYEPVRMRRVWEDIDHARDKLGLGGRVPPPASPPSWVGSMLAWGFSLVGDAVTRLESAPGRVQAAVSEEVDRRAATCRPLVRGVVAAARQIPVVGWLASWLPVESDPDDRASSS